jgi:hypothetical protein
MDYRKPYEDKITAKALGRRKKTLVVKHDNLIDIVNSKNSWTVKIVI